MIQKEKIKKLIEEAEKEYYNLGERSVTPEEAEFYSTQEGKKLIERAEKIYKSGIEKYLSLPHPTVKEARKLPKKTPAQRFFRDETIALALGIRKAEKVAAKYFRDGIKEFDPNVFEVLLRAEESTQKDIERAEKSLSEKQKSADKQAEEKLKKELAKSIELKKSIQKQLKKAEKVYSLYKTAAQPYLQSRHTVEKLKAVEKEL